MKLKILISLLFGALFVWIAVAGVDLAMLGQAFRTMDPAPMVPFLLLITVYQLVRVWRWKLLLDSTYPISFRSLFSINAVGFMAINLLPARLGEFARPYLLLERENVPLGAGLASAVVERMLDFLAMLLILGLVVFAIDLPTHAIVVKGETYNLLDMIQKVFLMAALPLVGGLVGLLLFEGFMYRLLHFTVGRFLPGLAARMEGFFRAFMSSVRPLRNPKILLVQVLLTLLIWSMTVVSEWLMFKVFHIELGLDAALTVVASLLIGMLIPAPPGFAGNFEAFTMAGLSLYQVTGGVALAYALMLHWSQFALVFLLGMYFLNRDQISFGKLVRLSQSVRGKDNTENGAGQG